MMVGWQQSSAQVLEAQRACQELEATKVVALVLNKPQ